MSITTHGYFKYDCSVIKVEDRWYICSDADYVSPKFGVYVYTTPTLKFDMHLNEDHWQHIHSQLYHIEIFGSENGIKLGYL